MLSERIAGTSRGSTAHVLILVVMEDALGDTNVMTFVFKLNFVLILVVMEDALGDERKG